MADPARAHASAQSDVENQPSPEPSTMRRALALAIVVAVMLLVLAGLGWLLGRTFGWFDSPDAVIRLEIIAPPAPNDPKFQAVPMTDPELAKLPYAPGWPMALPGEIVATPAVADLMGDGHLEVVVPCYARGKRVKYAHPLANDLPLLFAFRADGSVLPGWPIKLKPADDPERQWGGWASSPSVFRKDGKDMFVIIGPNRTVDVIGGDRSVQSVGDADATVAVPIVDLFGRGETDLIAGNLGCQSDGEPITGFPQQALAYGYAPCIGDAAGDGHLVMFHLHYGNGDDGYPHVIGYDSTGQKLSNWDKVVPMETWRPPVMGDIDGSGTMSIVAGYGHTIFVWHNTGKPFEGTETQNRFNGIFKRHILSDTGAPALADLTGSGHADIVVCDRSTHTLHAWHADGKPVWPAPPGLVAPHIPPPATRPTTQTAADTAQIKAAAMDGTFATLPAGASGVSVASLGDDPHVFDFFAGTFWIRHFPDNHVTITNMLPAPPSPARTEWTQPTIADLEHAGQADIIFGTTDGRLVVYRTGLAYHPERMEWPTVNGNFQHTGAWIPPAKRQS
jgi:hypothetical protein